MASISRISRKGEIIVSFDKEMFIVPDKEIITDSTVTIAGTERPTVEISIIPGLETLEKRDIAFGWDLIDIDSGSMQI